MSSSHKKLNYTKLKMPLGDGVSKFLFLGIHVPTDCLQLFVCVSDVGNSIFVFWIFLVLIK